MSNLLLLGGMLAFFVAVQWLVGIVMSAFALLALALLSSMSKRAIPLWKEQRRMSADYYGFLSERLEGLEDIRANGAGRAMLRDFYQLLRKWLPINNRAIIAGAEMGITMLLLFVCGTALSLALRLSLSSLRMVSLGTVYVLFSYANSLSQPLD